ncbi:MULTISPECIES: hypothetical protein [unclassified Myxococcus]|jgi:hypothetical protein|uniref:hypothetical protein n=1 Tax=unclassified Myxococcus TaxID=2648731 RepID=UPI001CBDC2E0|nr:MULTISPECIES: hypothetical protein [unclassified Myxococcus]MBZ4395724.1 hypothetical protein [Myxococcus sp. AS-1-15]MBZ4411340.1 hypothetical protein [Myxococcus sp. XM-1-1-1]
MYRIMMSTALMVGLGGGFTLGAFPLAAEAAGPSIPPICSRSECQYQCSLSGANGACINGMCLCYIDV